MAAHRPTNVIAFGAGFGAPELLASRVAAASTGIELPGGTQLYFPATPGTEIKRYVLLYGSPGIPGLGVLGEQDPLATVERARQQAAEYQALTSETITPGTEIIATVATSTAGEDGNYSDERPIEALLPQVQAAGDAGMIVVLDLQPGRADFLTQAQRYAPLLELPFVSLALDPEWRLGPDQQHLRQIGQVSVDEVNAVSAWLAQFVRERNLPQKLLVIHQFAPHMIVERERLDTSHDELAVVIHMDGQGTPGGKFGTWQLILQDAPPNVHWGWKNFVHEDRPMLSPGETLAVTPRPEIITYQ
jgi:hypothetical protein